MQKQLVPSYAAVQKCSGRAIRSEQVECPEQFDCPELTVEGLMVEDLLDQIDGKKGRAGAASTKYCS